MLNIHIRHLESEKKKVKVLVAQSCLNLDDPVDCSPPDSSVYGVSQARILEWVAFPTPGNLIDTTLTNGDFHYKSKCILQKGNINLGMGFPLAQALTYALQCRRYVFDSWVGKIP